MILAIDMGNTNTVIGGIDEKKTYFIERVTTDQSRTATEYAVSFKNILEMCGIDVADIEGAILSSVVPPLNSVILTAVEKVTGIRPLLVGSGMKTGMNILMDNPKSVGSDQIVDAVAASHEHPLPLINCLRAAFRDFRASKFRPTTWDRRSVSPHGWCKSACCRSGPSP